ncbi:MAG: 3-dehydroquinate synthase [Alphaproteobacteria bacterium]|nr:3-dehydroquinate synthase [Alphaproteobacteria bacterium]
MNGSDTVRMDLGDRAYDIIVGAGQIARLGEAVRDRFGQRRAFIVTDDEVAHHWLEPARRGLEASGIATSQFILPKGESTKSFAQLERLLDWLLGQHVGRDGLVIALGGGVVGDLAGFAAAITLRGLDFVQVPTTLLSQVDSSVGGKTAINMAHGKNLVGAFHQPGLVLIDTVVLDTLPRREVLAGYGEVVKYGLIRDPDFFDWLERNGGKVLAGDPEARRMAIVESCKAKARIVAADERETGDRALLNFGHTFGHSLEAEAGYGGGVLHGEAVSIGMILALDLSREMGLCSGQDVDRVRQHFGDMGLPMEITAIAGSREWSAPALINHMRHDKKVLAGQMRFILARGIGDAFVTAEVDERHVTKIIERSLASDMDAVRRVSAMKK